MLKISNVKIKADVKVNKEILAKKVAKILRVSANAIKDLSIVKKSIDARDIRPPSIWYASTAKAGTLR